jgi:hypothetical protein
LFLQRSYREVSKQLLPGILFPSTKEYRAAMEKYLDEHAEHFIESIGRNSWVSLFEEKLLPEVSKILKQLKYSNYSNYNFILVEGKMQKQKERHRCKYSERDIFSVRRRKVRSGR